MLKLLIQLLLFIELSYAAEKIKFFRGGGWSPWEEWTKCSKMKYCYSGTRYRQRKCLKHFKQCIGVFMESENCPVKHCEDSPQTILSDVAEASTSSFISQECDTDIKYSVIGTHAQLVPTYVRKYFEKYKRKFESGYFNMKNLLHPGIENVTKYCFEPWHLTFLEANEIYRFNRTTKSSLAIDEEDPHPDSLIAGITLVLNIKEHTIAAAYFALKSSKLGHQNVIYRRWRGMGFEEAL